MLEEISSGGDDDGCDFWRRRLEVKDEMMMPPAEDL